MRLMDVKRLATSYGLAIDSLGSLLYVELFYWKLVWGQDGRWDLLPAPKAFITLGVFESDKFSSTEKADERNSEGCFKISDYRIVNFVRNSTHYISTLKIRNLDELKQFFDDFYAKWAERRKIHKIQEISSIADRYTV